MPDPNRRGIGRKPKRHSVRYRTVEPSCDRQAESASERRRAVRLAVRNYAHRDVHVGGGERPESVIMATGGATNAMPGPLIVPAVSRSGAMPMATDAARRIASSLAIS